MLHLSEHEAFLRITVARASREHPGLLEMLRDGRVHLSGIAKLAPHLTAKNRETLLRRAVHKTKREIEEVVAELAPRPEAATVVRKLPDRAPLSAAVRVSATDREAPQLGLGRPLSVPPAPPRSAPSTVTPVAPARYRVYFDASAELREKLERLQALMRGSVPDGDLAKVIEAAVSDKLERMEARRYARTKRPRKTLAETDPTGLRSATDGAASALAGLRQRPPERARVHAVARALIASAGASRHPDRARARRQPARSLASRSKRASSPGCCADSADLPTRRRRVPTEQGFLLDRFRALDVTHSSEGVVVGGRRR